MRGEDAHHLGVVRGIETEPAVAYRYAQAPQAGIAGRAKARAVAMMSCAMLKEAAGPGLVRGTRHSACDICGWMSKAARAATCCNTYWMVRPVTP